MGGLTGEIITNSLSDVLPGVLLILGLSVVLAAVVYVIMLRVFHSKNALAYGLFAPAAVGLTVFVLGPFVFNILIAFSNWRLQNLKNPSFGFEYGLANLQRIFYDPQLQAAGPLLNTPQSTFPILFGRTVVWTVVNVVFHVLGGMGLALLLNRPLKLRGLYRTLLIIPWAIPQVIVALAWRSEFNGAYGFINIMLARLGLTAPPWLQDPSWAFLAVIIVNVWLGIPFMMVVILGGLQSIAGEYYEAAEIDGASRSQQFRSITLPLLRPVLGPAITLGMIWTFNNFNIMYLVTNGGEPAEQSNILVTALYNAAFGFSKYGFAAMFSLVIFAILFIFAYAWIRYSGALKGVYES
jgi:arabinogalactan oligomer/maltooligosaccharide transport system permease protein